MKIFFQHNEVPKFLSRVYLADWIKPLFPRRRHSLYGLDSKDLTMSDEKSNADAFVLPLTWNYYFEYGKIQDALDLIKEYGRWNKPIYTWIGGDYTFRVPDGDFFLFRQSGYQSERRKNEHAYPVIIRDPLDFLSLEDIKIITKATKPEVSFCGLSDNKGVFNSLRLIKTTFNKMVNSITKPYLDLSKPISGTALRGKALRILQNSVDVETNFLIRNATGGQSTNSKKLRLEFWENMLASPYVLCGRGAGNFSTRFYETLALGRIPVFINSDCVLPMDNQIDWNDHCVWVEANELRTIIKKINNFHRNLSKYHFQQLQIQNRKIWFDKLTFHGFFKSNMKKINN